MADRGEPTRALGAAHADPPLAAGDQVADWLVVRHLATGGFGAVYEVRHADDGTRGALKLLHAELCRSPEMTARLVREAELIAGLRHPGIVALRAVGTEARGRPYLVMELLTGRDLATLVADRGRLPPPEVLALLTPLVDALAVVHTRGVIHRDLKASNVFVTADEPPRVVLLDFGIAKLLDGEASALTSSRVALGTPSSMAPEQIRGEPVDARTDVYALGALTYHLLTGRPPFDDATGTVSRHLHLYAARPRPSAMAPVDPRLDEVVARAMALAPASRPADARTFLAALAAALAPASTTHRRLAHGALVAIVAPADDDDALADDADRLLALAEAELAADGFVLARELGDRALFVHADLDDARAVAAADRALAAVARRPGADPRVKAAVLVHRAEVVLAGDRPEAGPLLDVAAWAPAAPAPGRSCTAAVTPPGERWSAAGGSGNSEP